MALDSAGVQTFPKAVVLDSAGVYNQRLVISVAQRYKLLWRPMALDSARIYIQRHVAFDSAKVCNQKLLILDNAGVYTSSAACGNR